MWHKATLLPLSSLPLPIKADILLDAAQSRSNVMGRPPRQAGSRRLRYQVRSIPMGAASASPRHVERFGQFANVRNGSKADVCPANFRSGLALVCLDIGVCNFGALSLPRPAARNRQRYQKGNKRPLAPLLHAGSSGIALVTIFCRCSELGAGRRDETCPYAAPASDRSGKRYFVAAAASPTSAMGGKRTFLTDQSHEAIANARNNAEAPNMTVVAIQPSVIVRFDTDSRPIARGLRTMSIITAIKGAARMPLTTAAQ